MPFAKGLFAGRRLRGVEVRDELLAAPHDAVRLRRFERTGGAGSDAPLVVFFPDADTVTARGRRSGDWLAASLARSLPVVVTTVQIPASVIDDREAAFEALLRAVTGAGAGTTLPKIALLGVGTGGALAARIAMRARDARDTDAQGSDDQGADAQGTDAPSGTARGGGVPPIQRQALISPDFALLAGPPATEDALHTSLVARLAELPATLVQQYGDRAVSRSDPSQNLVELLRESGVAVRAIAYPPHRLDWTEHPRAVRSSARALDDLVAFLERGIVADGFDVVPAWNLH